MRQAIVKTLVAVATLTLGGSAAGQTDEALLREVPKTSEPQFELLLKGGHVIDPKNGVDGVFDVAISGGKVARVDPSIPESAAEKTIRLDGLLVTPGLIDIHTHNYAGTGLRALTGDQSLYPDPFSFRTGVTTMVDAGTAGWRNFPDFRQRIIDRATTRVLAFLNISGVGMAPEGENDPSDMDPQAAVRIARDHKDVIVGFKVAHFEEESWLDLDNALKAGRATGLPIMVDFGYTGGERNLGGLLRDKLRKGDIYTHCYSGHRDELLESGKLNPAMTAGRKRGILFDLGHGAGSFYWNIAVPAFEQGFLPDTISTDLHTGSMNGGMKDVPNVMSKVLNLGVPLADVIRMSTWSAATSINRPELGHLGVGAGADITVLRVEEGDFGFVDAAGARRPGSKRLAVEMTIRDGRVVWDLNGRASQGWETFPYKKRERPKPRATAPSK
jgi:dihydroorotase